MHYFRLVFSQFNQAWGQFLRVWTKNAISRKFLRKFWKIFKSFRKKIAKIHYCSRFFTKFKKLCVNFWRVWTKNAISRRFFRKFSKIVKFFLQKIAKNALFLQIFQKHLTNYALIFCAFGRKAQIVGKFSENFEIF